MILFFKKPSELWLGQNHVKNKKSTDMPWQEHMESASILEPPGPEIIELDHGGSKSQI